MQKGDRFEHFFVVSNAVYAGFIAVFNDRNPLHTDPDCAKAYGFKSVVMHGNILNGFISYFIGECLPVKNVIIQTQQIQFNLPVYAGDELKLCAEVSDVFESVSSLEFRFYFQNAGMNKVAKGKIQIGLLK